MSKTNAPIAKPHDQLSSHATEKELQNLCVIIYTCYYTFTHLCVIFYVNRRDRIEKHDEQRVRQCSANSICLEYQTEFANRVFHKNKILAIMPLLASEALLHVNKNIQWQNITTSGNRIRASHSLWFQVQRSPFWTNFVFACKTGNLGSLYSHSLLIPTKWLKSKNKVMQEQKFKDPLSSTCPLSSERRVLDLASKVHENPAFYPHSGCHFVTGFFCFHVVTSLMPILPLLPFLSSMWKTQK